MNPPDELAQNVSKKSFSDELSSFFPSNVQNLTVFSIIDMIRIRFFGPGGRKALYFVLAEHAYDHQTKFEN